MNVKDKSQILEMNQCEVCQEEAFRRCGGCHKVYYCNKQHQKDNWVLHKPVCRGFKVCQDDDQGSFLVATRTINPGEFILEESPLIWGPSSKTIPVCLGCGKKIDAKTSRPCLKCGWPVCDDLCEKSPSHLPECRYTSQRGDRVCVKKFGVPHPIYRCVTILRCLYHKQFLPNNWKKFEKLKKCKEREKEWMKITEFIRRFFKLYSVFSVDEVLEVCGLVMINGHEVPSTELSYVAIYGTASSMEHNCGANCTISFTNLGQIVISAAKPIKEEDHLTVSHVNPLWATSNRRYHLYENRFFWCHCQRCEDPTEFGTNFGALRCQITDCDGYLLPPTFTDLKKLPDWVCKTCGRSVSSYLVHDILERAERDFDELDKDGIEDCKKFLTIYGCYLHENHFYGVSVKYLLSQLLGQTGIEDLTDEDLVVKLQFCQDLESLVKVLAPVDKRVLGKVLFEKSVAVEELGRRSEPEKLVYSLNESKKTLVEVLDLLKYEPSVFLEGKIYEKAVQKLANVDEMLQKLK